VLYSTCSLENAENSPQAEGLARRLRGRVEAMEAREPSGRPGEPDTTYADGTFGALVKAG
jgi:16S rRNA C967 or C1407 C5-methylase (RsmB/RsmF family)